MESEKKLRILMLHGWSQNGKLFSDRTGPLRRKLRAIADLVYITAPHELPMIEGGRENAKAWFYYNAENILETSHAFRVQANVEYHKWNESREHIANSWIEHGGFDGVCGFSQGAVTLHQLLVEMHLSAEKSPEEATGSHLCSPSVRFLLSHPPRFAILVAGFPSNHTLPGGSPILPGLLLVPSLHVISDEDFQVPKELHAQLIDRFVAGPHRQVIKHDKGHQMPHQAALLDRLVDFVEPFLSKLP